MTWCSRIVLPALIGAALGAPAPMAGDPASVAQAVCQAGLPDAIGFERLPDGSVPRERMEIGETFASQGVRFSLATGALPVLAEVGGPVAAFMGPPRHRRPDRPADGQGVGRFFLTDDGRLRGGSVPLIVDYLRPTAEAGGVILDIDGGETFVLEIFGQPGAVGPVLERIRIAAGDKGTGDGLATPFAFRRDRADIRSLRLSGRKRGAAFGLAFDNFTPFSAACADLATGDGGAALSSPE